jgi:hypothetical protein
MPTSRIIDHCQGCDSPELKSVLWLGYMQPACTMQKIGDVSEAMHYPLELMQCQKCSLVQLSCIVDPEVLFHPDYPYSSGNTKALRENFARLTAEILYRWLPSQTGNVLVDIGANDGSLLETYDPGNWLLGIEPTNQALVAKAKGLEMIQKPFSAALVDSIGVKANVITASNVLAHVADIHDVLEGVAGLLDDHGIFVTENHDLGSLVEHCQWDFIYHEHLRYYSYVTLVELLRQHGLYVFNFDQIPIHGGSFRLWASKKSRTDAWFRGAAIDGFAGCVAESRAHIRHLIGSAKGRIVAVGAAARGATLLNACGIDVDMVEAVAEVKGSDKIGYYMPGTRISIVDEEMIYRTQPDNLFLLPWHLASDLIPMFRAKGYQGKFINPMGLPTLVNA